MNMETWNSLPADLQAIVTDPDMIAALEAANHDDGFGLETSSMQWAKDTYGTTAIIPDEAAMQEFLDKLTESKSALAKKLDDQGYPGTEMIAAVSDYAAG